MSSTDRHVVPSTDDELTHLTEPGRIAAKVGIDDDANGRLLVDVSCADPSVAVLPGQVPARRRIRRRLRGGAALAAAGAALAAASVTAAPAANAAIPTAVRMPAVTVTIAGPSTTVRTRVPGTTTQAWMQTTTGGALRLPVRRGYAGRALPSRLVRPGESVIELVQVGGGVVRVPVVALRRTRVSAPDAMCQGGLCLVQGIVSHYDARFGGYAGDQLSPVAVQTLSPIGRWRTVAVLTTDRTGALAGAVRIDGGRQMVRLSRPVGSTVTGGVGVAVPVDPASGTSTGWGY